MGGGTGVAAHPVAQLTEQVIPTRSLTQHPHRPHPPRTHTFHTIYDHQGRVKEAKSGIEAHGQTETDLSKLPYRQSYTFNALGNLTGRDSTLWNYTNGDWDFSYTIVNNRRQYGAYYDDDGRQTSEIGGTNKYFSYDAAGRMIRTSEGNDELQTWRYYDGDGREVKRSSFVEDPEAEQSGWSSYYFIYSSVLGKLVTETYQSGAKKSTYVYGAGAIVAQQIDNGSSEYVSWRYTDASGLSSRGASNPEELDALGNNVGIIPNLTPPDRGYDSYSPMEGVTFDDMTMGDCELDGIITPCSMLQGMGEALAVGGLYWSPENGFRHRQFERVGELPGRIPLFFLPDRVTTTRTDNGFVGGPNVTQGYSIQETVFPGNQGQWITFELGNSNSSCYSLYDLIYKNPDVRRIMDDLWTSTVLSAEEVDGHRRTGVGRWRDRHSGAEAGGALFYDQKSNTMNFGYVEGAEPPKNGETARMPLDFFDQIASFQNELKKQGKSGQIALLIHTHPPNGPAEFYGPYLPGDPQRFSWDPAAVESNSRRPSGSDLQSVSGDSYFGIVVWGKGKFTVYADRKYDDDTLKRTCLGSR